MLYMGYYGRKYKLVIYSSVWVRAAKQAELAIAPPMAARPVTETIEYLNG